MTVKPYPMGKRKPIWVGERVRLKMPQMTKFNGTKLFRAQKLSKTGYVVRTDGGNIWVRPSRWPKGLAVHFYRSEVSRMGDARRHDPPIPSREVLQSAVRGALRARARTNRSRQVSTRTKKRSK